MLYILNLSMIIIVSIGWLLRLSIIPMDTFFEVELPQFKIGYWGIRYLSSTRNHDFLYAVVGLSISLYLYISHRIKYISLVLIIFFEITLIASFSRTAIIVVFLSLILLYKESTKSIKYIFISLVLALIILNIDIVKSSYDSTYKSIISSIFELKNKDTRFSNSDRIEVIGDALSASLINPVGYGINNYAHIYYNKSNNKRVSNSGENAFLTILVERGWLALLFFILTFKSLFFTLRKSKNYSLSYFLLPFLTIYFIFNYELNSVFPCFLFYILFLDSHFLKQTNICQTKN